MLRRLYGLPVLAVFLPLLLQACFGSDGQIGGKVVRASDGEPLAGVRVSIAGSAFKTETGPGGSYSIDYVPGEITLFYAKPGYLPNALKVSIAQRLPFPAVDVRLTELPKPVNWAGDLLADADVVVDTNGGEPFRSVVDSKGRYELPLVIGAFRASFQAPGCQNLIVQMDTVNQTVPGSIILFPESPGLFVGTQRLNATEIRFDKTQMQPYQGNLVIPRIPGLWEGRYFAEGPPNAIATKDGAVELFFYPDTKAYLGGNVFGGADSVRVLQPKEDGLLANFGPQSSEMEVVECEVTPVVDRQGGNEFVQKREVLLKMVVPVYPGVPLAVCEWSRSNQFEPMRPGQHAWLLLLEDSPADLTDKAETDNASGTALE